nr:hypothetical protein [Mycobacterium pseudokansasii]
MGHKAVAFDVYRYIGGTERMRIRSMAGMLALLWAPIILLLVSIANFSTTSSSVVPSARPGTCASAAANQVPAKWLERGLRSRSRTAGVAMDVRPGPVMLHVVTCPPLRWGNNGPALPNSHHD